MVIVVGALAPRGPSLRRATEHKGRQRGGGSGSGSSLARHSQLRLQTCSSPPPPHPGPPGASRPPAARLQAFLSPLCLRTRRPDPFPGSGDLVSIRAGGARSRWQWPGSWAARLVRPDCLPPPLSAAPARPARSLPRSSSLHFASCAAAAAAAARPARLGVGCAGEVDGPRAQHG